MKRGTFLVTRADDTAVLRDVASGQVHTLASNPGLSRGTVLDATVAPDPPLEVTWSLETVHDRREVAVERESAPPPARAVEAAADDDPGEVLELDDDSLAHHVLVVPGERTDGAAEEVLADEATLTRAARLGATRVTVRAGDGVVAVRYR
ncbi:MAG: DUF5812 family protein [Halobacteriaceae archaeon]